MRHCRVRVRLVVLLILPSIAALAQLSGSAYQLINSRASVNQSGFFVYQDADSGYNHGFPSGFFGQISSITVNSACVFDPQFPTGCSTSSTAFDAQHGTVLAISFGTLAPKGFAGVNIEEPEHFGETPGGVGYDLTGCSTVSFDIYSPTSGMNVQISVAGHTSGYFTAPQTWTTMTFSLSDLGISASDLTNVHLLFGIATNLPPSGGTVLLDNVQFLPPPNSRSTVLSLPASSQVFGVTHVTNTLTGSITIPPDQIDANLATLYESSIAEIALLRRGNPADLVNAKEIANALVYALGHENAGDPIPAAADGVGLHNGYSTGDLALFNAQATGAQAGQVRLAGFSAATLCPQTEFCLVLDGATGGNNAFAILALMAAYQQFSDSNYFASAIAIGNWIYENLTDNTGIGFGGYYVGYEDNGVPPPKPLNHGKSVENNADIFAAFSALASAENKRGNSATAAEWTRRANIAGDFVMSMFDQVNGRFYAGTVPQTTGASFGITPNGPAMGNDITNTFDFLDTNTFTTLALAQSPRYRNQVDWRRPIQYVLSHFQQSVTVAGQQFTGFNLIQPGISQTPNGIAWEFTSQAVETLHAIDSLYGQSQFEATASSYLGQILSAQAAAPFADQQGLVAATLQDGDLAHTPPYQACLVTPFQCIPERVGLAATTWAIFADQQVNPFFVLPYGGEAANDLTIWRPISGTWFALSTSMLAQYPNPSIYQQWGLPGDIPVPGDYDGDGKIDFAVWRPSNGTWFVLLSTATSQYPNPSIEQQWGLPGDIPVPGDYDGDGKTDFAVWRPSTQTWFVLYSTAVGQYPNPSIQQQWGLPGDIPVPGDYDGDGKTDFAVWRPSIGTWFVLSPNALAQYPLPSIQQQWGLPGDIPIVGDFNADGKTDFAVWRPSNGIWFVLYSTSISQYPTPSVQQQWGLQGDEPIAGDFNGDGKSDFVVWRPAIQTWFVLFSNAVAQYPISSIEQQWGVPGDVPVVFH